MPPAVSTKQPVQVVATTLFATLVAAACSAMAVGALLPSTWSLALTVGGVAATALCLAAIVLWVVDS